MARMTENLEKALRVMPSDASPEETRQLIDALREAGNLEALIRANGGIVN